MAIDSSSHAGSLVDCTANHADVAQSWEIFRIRVEIIPFEDTERVVSWNNMTTFMCWTCATTTAWLGD